MSNIILGKLILEEGYCCMYGYLRLCKHRGEHPSDMALYMGVASSTVRYHYTKIYEDRKNHRCQGEYGCMAPLFIERT